MKLSEFSTVSRVFMNVQDGGKNKSTGRFIIYQTSFNEIVNYQWELVQVILIFTLIRDNLLSKKIYHPHNLFEVFIEFGLFSFILFLYFFILLEYPIKKI